MLNSVNGVNSVVNLRTFTGLNIAVVWQISGVQSFWPLLYDEYKLYLATIYFVFGTENGDVQLKSFIISSSDSVPHILKNINQTLNTDSLNSRDGSASKKHPVFGFSIGIRDLKIVFLLLMLQDIWHTHI